MKQYKLDVREYQFSFGTHNAVILGERGRRRWQVIIPVASQVTEESLVDVTLTKNHLKIGLGTSSDGWLARLNCCGCYTRGTIGVAYVHKQDAGKIELITYGYGAYGDAGRCGDWNDYLVVIQDGTLVKIKKSGGYKRPAMFLFFGKSEVLEISKEEVHVWADMYGYDVQGECFELIKEKEN